MDTYYNRPEVSNSDLTALYKYLYPDFISYDPEVAFKFGNLIDYMITEPQKVNYFTRMIEGYPDPFFPEDFKRAEEMKKSAKNDAQVNQLLQLSTFQKVFVGDVNLKYGNIDFSLRMRCKYDMFMNILGWGADIKSTAATTMNQFIDACYHFDYDRSRVVYMLLSGSEKDMIIGISKKNYQVFKIPIVRGDAFWNSGMEKLTDIAFKYWMLFENFNKAA
jgi:hypothetical protein